MPLFEKVRRRPWGELVVAGVNTHVDKIKAKSVVAHQIWSDMQLKHKTDYLSFDEAKLVESTLALEALYKALDDEFLADIRAMR